MIQLHTLAHTPEPFHLNPDLIERLDASPDCHITLTTGTRIGVTETVEQVAARVREFRVGILADALRQAR
jgi:flagellar protein FlbD